MKTWIVLCCSNFLKMLPNHLEMSEQVHLCCWACIWPVLWHCDIGSIEKSFLVLFVFLVGFGCFLFVFWLVFCLFFGWFLLVFCLFFGWLMKRSEVEAERRGSEAGECWFVTFTQNPPGINDSPLIKIFVFFTLSNIQFNIRFCQISSSIR